MADDIEKLELLSLVAKVHQEICNHANINDKTLAEFVIALHDESKSLADFKQQLQDAGAGFSDFFVENIDRLILSMHPKHKKKTSANGNGVAGSGLNEMDKAKRMFPGLSLPDQDWQPSAEKDQFMKSVDDMMADLEGMAKKKKVVEPASAEVNGNDHSSRRRRSRSKSPRRGRSR